MYLIDLTYFLSQLYLTHENILQIIFQDVKESIHLLNYVIRVDYGFYCSSSVFYFVNALLQTLKV